MRIAVLIKQIPAPAELRMAEGRVVRDGVPTEVNAYCRRANAKAVELAGEDGEVVVFTMGPPSAADGLREMIHCGAHRGVHLCDPAFAGSDTLATAVALAAALRKEGPFDLVLAGLNSLDADTGQVPAETAELLGLAFAAGVRDLEISQGVDQGDLAGEHGEGSRGDSGDPASPNGVPRRFTARLEADDGYRTVTGELPVMLSTAERLCYPSKAPAEDWQSVPMDKITLLGATDLDVSPDSLGAAGSPTSVGPIRTLEASRQPAMAQDVTEALELLTQLGAFAENAQDVSDTVSEGEATTGLSDPGSDPHAGPQIWCFFTDAGVGSELLGEAADLARSVDGSVTAVTTEAGLASFVAPSDRAGAAVAAAGADRVLVIPPGRAGQRCEVSEQADALASAAGAEQPWALLVEGTRSGRVVASVVAARHGWGLTGDAIGLEIEATAGGPSLIAWKPAFGGRVEAPIRSSSPVQMATIRPGVLARRSPRHDAPSVAVEMLPAPEPARLRTVSEHRDDTDSAGLTRAEVVVALGQGVEPDGYPVMQELCDALGGAVLGATRKVTDQGWLPRSRQIGVTGLAVAPRLLVAVGSSGRFNHTVGIRNAKAILAINPNPAAEIFDQVDVGLVGPWQEVVPALTKALTARTPINA